MERIVPAADKRAMLGAVVKPMDADVEHRWLALLKVFPQQRLDGEPFDVEAAKLVKGEDLPHSRYWSSRFTFLVVFFVNVAPVVGGRSILAFVVPVVGGS
jgi:hypothetical protein